jgi:hypothetical protein
MQEVESNISKTSYQEIWESMQYLGKSYVGK